MINMADSPHTHFCQLPEKYDIDLEVLREGLESVNALEQVKLYPMDQHPSIGRIRRVTGMAGENNDAPTHFKGYSGICFKSEKGMENDLYQGLSSNVTGTNSKKALEVGIDSTFTEPNNIWFPYLAEIESKFKGQVTQMRLINLHARHNLGRKMHTDYPWYKGLRLHIPLTDDLVYKWRVRNEYYEVNGANGHMYYLNTGVPHTAINDHSDKDRLVFNVNMIPHTLEISIDDQIEQEIL